jgi:hypothetical protein
MYIRLSSLIPNADDLLALDVEELSGVLLTHLNSCGVNSGDSVVPRGLISQHNFLRNLEGHPEYPNRHPEVSQALMEAWSWLQGEAFLIPDASQPAGWFFLSRRAQRLKSRTDFAEYRKATLLPKAQLHPLIAPRSIQRSCAANTTRRSFRRFARLKSRLGVPANFRTIWSGRN